MQFKIFDLQLVDFKEAEGIQKEVFRQIKNGAFESGIIICQHYPVITIGRTGKRKNILASEKELKNQGIAVYQIERGGDVTYHGPGQLNVYPIFNLNYFKKDIHLFLRYLENLLINLLSDFGIKALRYPGLTGVWIDPVRDKTPQVSDGYLRQPVSNGVDKQKIASIGIAIRNWITFHGLSINVKKNDLANFQMLKPCGMDVEMTSLETALGKEVEINNIKEKLINKFCQYRYACLPVGRGRGGSYDESNVT